jgi:hypothetical protein
MSYIRESFPQKLGKRNKMKKKDRVNAYKSIGDIYDLSGRTIINAFKLKRIPKRAALLIAHRERHPGQIAKVQVQRGDMAKNRGSPPKQHKRKTWS